MVICPEAMSAQNSMAAVSALGSAHWIFTRRLNSPWAAIAQPLVTPGAACKKYDSPGGRRSALPTRSDLQNAMESQNGYTDGRNRWSSGECRLNMAVENRNDVAWHMTPAQIAEAQKLARERQKKHQL